MTSNKQEAVSAAAVTTTDAAADNRSVKTPNTQRAVAHRNRSRKLPLRDGNYSFGTTSTISSVGDDYLDDTGHVRDLNDSCCYWDGKLEGDDDEFPHHRHRDDNDELDGPEEYSDWLDDDGETGGADLMNDKSLNLLDFDVVAHRPSKGELKDESSFHDSFISGVSLGQGSFGSVRRCVMKEDVSGSGRSGYSHSRRRRGSWQRKSSFPKPGQAFAVKEVPAHQYNPEEIEILLHLGDCPSIVQLHQVFHETKSTYVVMEEIAGGDLLERIRQKECYLEKEAKPLFKTLLETVQFCHSRGIAHCDLKPENIMLVSPDDDIAIKLTDFGMAKSFVDEDGNKLPLFDMEGSPEYAAPQVFNRDEEEAATVGYDERCDIWSCGVILYVMLAGYAPFEAEDVDEMIAVVGKGKFKFHKRYWKDVSSQAKALIVQMMQVDPSKRCTLQEALDNPWFADLNKDNKNKRNSKRNSGPAFKRCSTK